MTAMGNVSLPLNTASAVSSASSSSSPNSTAKSSSLAMSGYNPNNGNYYGDGSNLKYDAEGRALSNIKTGAYYKDNNIALGRSDEGFKTQLDYQIQHINSYTSNAKKAGNQNAITFAEENKKRLLNGDAIVATMRYDARGFGYSGNTDENGRDYLYDPYTRTSTGNVKMADSTYDLMRDSNYSHYNSYSEEVWDNYFNSWVDNGQLKDTTIDKQWLMSFKDNWNKYRLLNPNEVSPWGAKALEDIAPLPNGTRMPRYIGYQNGGAKWEEQVDTDVAPSPLPIQQQTVTNNQIQQQTVNNYPVNQQSDTKKKYRGGSN